MVAIISHDAGGAEILSSWLKQNKVNYCLSIDGPAINIFKNKGIEVKNISLEDAINQATWVLCGTSWMSNIENKAIVLSRKYNKKVIVFLDHWINYIERFEFNKTYVFPNEIWVGDEYAFHMASNLFLNKCKVILKNNPYFDEIKDLYKSIQYKDDNRKSILYVCEPIKKHALMKYGDQLYWGYHEDLAIEYFFSNLSKFKLDNYEIIIRPHPSEEQYTYQWVINKYPEYTIMIGGQNSLVQEIINSRIVVGCSSMAMVIALQLRKKVYSTIPPGRGICTLPFKEIKLLRNLNEVI